MASLNLQRNSEVFMSTKDIINGAAAAWPALKKWTRDGYLENGANGKATVYALRSMSNFFWDDAAGSNTREISFQTFLRDLPFNNSIHARSASTSPLYLSYLPVSQIDTASSELMSDLKPDYRFVHRKLNA